MLDLRAMTKAWLDYRLDAHGKASRPWRDLVRSCLTKVLGGELAAPAGRAARKSHEQEIALDLATRFPDDKRLRDAEWTRLTGKAEDSLYRRTRELKDEGRL